MSCLSGKLAREGHQARCVLQANNVCLGSSTADVAILEEDDRRKRCTCVTTKIVARFATAGKSAAELHHVGQGPWKGSAPTRSVSQCTK